MSKNHGKTCFSCILHTKNYTILPNVLSEGFRNYNFRVIIVTAINDETSKESLLSKAYKDVLASDLASNKDIPPDAERVSQHLLNQILFIRNNLNNPDALEQIEAIASAALVTGVQNMQLAGELSKNLEIQGQQLDSARQENEELERKLAESIKAAQTDILTQVPNRAGFNRSYNEIVNKMLDEYDPESGKIPTVSIAMLDLDTFKQLNDTYGHLNGDLVLQEFAQFMQDQASGYMTQNPNITVVVARIGGEEFGILFGNPDTKRSTHDAGAINWTDPAAESFFADLKEGYSKTVSTLNGDKVRNSTSLGLATDIRVTNIGRHDTARHMSITLKKADQALYIDKARPNKPTFGSRILSSVSVEPSREP